MVVTPKEIRATGQPLPRKAVRKVLLIDDDLAIVEAIADFLEEEGFLVLAAANGIDALNQLRSGLHVDVIVLDVRMPVMDGWEFRAAQLADPALRDIPVVIVTASRFAQDGLRADFKAYDALAKPIELERFLEVMKSACTGGGPRSAPS